MVEEIKLLLPLLEHTTTGAMWLIAGYLISGFLKTLLFAALIMFIVSKAVYVLRGVSMCVQLVEAVRNKNKIGSPGPLMPSEMEAVQELLREKGIL